LAAATRLLLAHIGVAFVLFAFTGARALLARTPAMAETVQAIFSVVVARRSSSSSNSDAARHGTNLHGKVSKLLQRLTKKMKHVFTHRRLKTIGKTIGSILLTHRLIFVGSECVPIGFAHDDAVERDETRRDGARS